MCLDLFHFIANGLCIVFGLSFGYYLANLKISGGLVKQFNDDLNFFV